MKAVPAQCIHYAPHYSATAFTHLEVFIAHVAGSMGARAFVTWLTVTPAALVGNGHGQVLWIHAYALQVGQVVLHAAGNSVSIRCTPSPGVLHKTQQLCAEMGTAALACQIGIHYCTTSIAAASHSFLPAFPSVHAWPVSSRW